MNFYMCGSKKKYKDDCYFLKEERTMEGLMHDCRFRSKLNDEWYIGNCPKNCPAYINASEIFNKIYSEQIKLVPEGYDFNVSEDADENSNDPLLNELINAKKELRKTQFEYLTKCLNGDL